VVLGLVFFPEQNGGKASTKVTQKKIGCFFVQRKSMQKEFHGSNLSGVVLLLEFM